MLSWIGDRLFKKINFLFGLFELIGFLEYVFYFFKFLIWCNEKGNKKEDIVIIWIMIRFEKVRVGLGRKLLN